MSNKNLSPYVLQEVADLTESIRFPLECTQRIKYICFDISKTLIVIGASSGGIYVFNRQPCEFVQLIPNKDGAIMHLAISPDERHIGFANGKGVVTVSEIVQSLCSSRLTEVSKEHIGNEVTALIWSSNTTLFSGDDAGRVSVLQLQSFITKNLFHSLAQTIMCLDSRICQLDVKDSMLLVSTFTRCYICDTFQEHYRQIGQKSRDGEFGACFVHNQETSCNEHKQNGTQSFTETKKFNIVDDESNFAVNENLINMMIFCSRPSSRLWEASIDGTVKQTHQFKQALAKEPMDIITSEYVSKEISLENDSTITEGRSVNFPKIFSMYDAIFSFTKDALYFLNIKNVDYTVWFKCKDILDCKVYHDMVYLWMNDGSLKNLRFMKIDKFLVKCYINENYALCSHLCAFFKEYLIHGDVSPKLQIVSGLRDKIQGDVLEVISDVLDRMEKLDNIESTRMESGIYLVDNSYQTQIAFDDNDLKPKVNIDDNMFTTTPEAIQTLKDLSLTVSDKFSTSKKLLKKKWGNFEEKMKHIGVEKQPMQELLLPKKVFPESQTNLESIPIQSDIIYKESSQDAIAIEIDNNSLESEKVCKSLYQYYRLSLVGKEMKQSNLISLIEGNACDIKEIYQLIVRLEQYCFKVGAVEESKIAPKNIFLNYLDISSRKDEYLDAIVKDGVLCKYFVDACNLMNIKTQKANDVSCECGFPLPIANSEHIPEFSDLIDVFLEKQWSSQTKEQCYEVCKLMPYLWKKILFLRKNDDLHGVLNLLLQMLDEDLLHSFLPEFTIDTWEKAIQLYATLHADKCLNCNKKFVNFSVKDTLSWEDLGLLLIKSVGGINAVAIMKKHSQLIDIGELTVKFYHTCMLVPLYEKYDATIRNALADSLYAAFDDENARKEICKLLSTTGSGYLKNTALPILVAYCSNNWGLIKTQESCHNNEQPLDIIRSIPEVSNDCTLCGLPLQNEVLIEDGGLWVFKCGHIFHGACLDLNKIKLCSSCTTPNV